MKRWFSLALILSMLVCLTGCNGYKYGSETDMEYMVSSIGVDTVGNKVSVFAEIIVVNSGSSDDAATAKLFWSSGENVSAALYNLHSKLAKPLMFNHCGLLAIGDGVYGDTLDGIFKILLENKNITQAIKVVSSRSAEALLSVKPTSDIAIGYELTTALKQNKGHNGINYKNRFYEIEASREKKSPCYALPIFTVENDSYKISGLKVYYNDMPVMSATGQDAALYAIMSNSFKKGKVKLGSECFEIRVKSVNYDFNYENNQLKTDVTVSVSASKDAVLKLNNAIKSVKISDTDIYGIADRMYNQNQKLFEKIKGNYAEIYKSASVNFILRGA